MWGGGGGGGGGVLVKVFFRGLGGKSILLAITYFCNYCIAEEEIND